MACGKPDCLKNNANKIKDKRTVDVMKQLDKVTTKTLINNKVYIVKPK